MDQIASDRFSARLYVQNLSAGQVTREQLIAKYKAVQEADVENSQALKDNVFRNYQLYIDASNEISQFEKDVDQLSLLLDEQSAAYKIHRELIVTGSAPGLTGNPEIALLHQVHGLDMSHKLLGRAHPSYHGKLLQLDPDTHDLRGTAHAFLLAKALVLARYTYTDGGGDKLSKSGSGPKLVLEGLEPIDSIKVGLANMKAHRHSFSVEGQSGTRLFACVTALERQGWVTAFNDVLAESGSGVDEEEDAGTTLAPGVEEWLVDVPGELDVFIAQRAFGDAVELASKVRHEIKGTARVVLPELSATIEGRIGVLIATLCRELKRPALRLPEINDVVVLLLKLGEAEQARRMYLKNRAGAIALELRNLKMEGSTVLFMMMYSRKIFGILRYTCSEFGVLFDDAAKSEFVSWVQKELEKFAEVFDRQVFQPVTSFDTKADCIQSANIACRRLAEEGLDLEFCLWGLLQRGTIDGINEEGRSWCVEIGALLEDELWQPQDFAGRHARKQFLEKLSKSGVADPLSYTHGLTTNVCEASFMLCQTSHKYVSSACKLLMPKVAPTVLSFLEQIFPMVAKRLLDARRAGSAAGGSTGKPAIRPEVIEVNFAFIMDVAVRARKQIERKTRANAPSLRNVEEKLNKMLSAAAGGGSMV